MATPTADVLRALAQEIAIDTDNDMCISRVEDLLQETDGIDAARYYLNGFISGGLQEDLISIQKAKGYFQILDLPEEESKRLAQRTSS